jgi:integrase
MESVKSELFIDHIRKTKAKNTIKEYMCSIAKFSDFEKKSLDQILEERRLDIASGDFMRSMHFSRELEAFHKNLLDRKFSINSARNYCIGIKQFFKFYGFPLVNLSGEISKTVLTTKDFVPSIQQYRDLFNASKTIQQKVIISMSLDLGWRIGDLVSLRKDQLPDLTQEPPIPFDLVTEKEKVLAKSFLSLETVELLKTYLGTLPKENPYLFPANHEKHLDGETINYHLNEVAKVAHIKIPEGKRLRYHCCRKRFLSECANLKIDPNTARILCGKDVEESMLTYLSEVSHRRAFIELKEVLNVSNGAIKKTIQTKDMEIEKLQGKVSELENMVRLMSEIYGKQILEKAKAELHISGEEGETKLSPYEALKLMAKLREKEEEKAYRKMLENGNGDSNGKQ